ncbi:hypothetical protein Tco_0007897 [Tanacetum coccineum]
MGELYVKTDSGKTRILPQLSGSDGRFTYEFPGDHSKSLGYGFISIALAYHQETDRSERRNSQTLEDMLRIKPPLNEYTSIGLKMPDHQCAGARVGESPTDWLQRINPETTEKIVLIKQRCNGTGSTKELPDRKHKAKSR